MHPTQSSIAFTMDKGGTENAQIYLLDPETASSQMLTDGISRNGGPLWSNSGDQIASKAPKEMAVLMISGSCQLMLLKKVSSF